MPPTDFIVPSFAPGSRIGDLVIERELGSGGCAQVYLADHPGLQRRVAVKVLNPEWAYSEQMLRRFFHEVRALSMVRHPHVVRVYGSSLLPDGRPWFWMEYVEGQDLRHFVEARGRLSPREAIALFESLASAVAAVHAAGIVHRDLKTSNILVTVEAGVPSAKVLDFGVARFVDGPEAAVRLTQTGMRIGTSATMAPEQFRGEPVDSRADIYALGVVLYFMLTGRYPFAARDDSELERMHLEEPPPPPSRFAQVPASIEQVVLRCLSKRREDRPAELTALVSALREALAEPGELDAGTRSAEEELVAVLVECAMDPAAERVDETAAISQMERILTSAQRELAARHLRTTSWVGTMFFAAHPLTEQENANAGDTIAHGADAHPRTDAAPDSNAGAARVADSPVTHASIRTAPTPDDSDVMTPDHHVRGPEPIAPIVQGAIDCARELAASVGTAAHGAGVRLLIAVHVARGAFTHSAGKLLLTGPIARVADWLPEDTPGPVFVSDAAKAALIRAPPGSDPSTRR